MMRYLEQPDGLRLAYHATLGRGPTVIFLGGFRSDMTGTKATFLEEKCRARGQACVRFDYRGHGQSDGDFAACTLGDWRDDALAILDMLTEGEVILVGSSMGGWLALLAAQARPQRVRGIVGIAAAPDFTRQITAALTPAQKDRLATQGFIDVPSAYSAGGYRITRALLADGENHCLLDQPLSLSCPLRLLHGQQDADVPWRRALAIEKACAGDVAVSLIPDGDHRLSRPEDLALIDAAVTSLSGF